MKYRNKFIWVLISIMFLMTAGCDFVSVPPTTKGKILTTSGYSPDVLIPGKYTLYGRDELVLLQTNTNTYKEVVNVVLQDKLTLSAEVRFRGRISGADNVINAMFNDIVPGADNTVSFHEVYNVYGKMAVRNKTREIIGQYSVEDVHKNYSRLSAQIGEALLVALKGTPLEISDVALGSIQYPAVVTAAIDAAKERELAIKKEEAQAEIDMTKKKNEQALAVANYKIEITKAKATRDANKILSQGITKSLLELKRLEVLSEMAANKSAIFMPVEGMMSAGAQMRMYSK